MSAYESYMTKQADRDFSELEFKPGPSPFDKTSFIATHRSTGETVGTLGWGHEPPHKGTRTAIIDTTKIDPKFQGRGVGQQLYLEARSHLKSLGYQAMATTLTPDASSHPDGRSGGASHLWSKLVAKGHAVEGPVPGHPYRGLAAHMIL